MKTHRAARGRKQFCKRALVVAISDALIFAPGAGWADSTPATGATQVYRAPNGVEVVDIATTNAQGLSHNKFTSYNVEQRGQVLNNGNISQMARQSELAGRVMYNRNLQQEATVILNEVVAPNRSRLEGYAEVLGRSADLVIANPYGITCSGCGFINTPNVTLATGQPQINGGLLSGFQVNGGDILITGAGLDASKPDYLSLVARSIRIDGQLNAQELSLAAGANQWDYSSRAVTGAASASGDVPGYAIDSSALGGMYANRIRLKATEAGVGVRMLGEAAASADDFSIDAAGKIQLQNKVSAERDIQLTSTSSESDAINASDAALTARRNLGLTADSGGISLQGGLLVAGNDINLSADTLSDAASNSGMDDNNQRYAAGELNFAITNAASLNGTRWGSAHGLDGEFGSLSVGANGATLYAGSTLALRSSGDLALADATLSSEGDLSLDAHGQLSTTGGAGQGIESRSGDIALSAGGLNHAGSLSAAAGNTTLRVDGSVDNSGTLHAHGRLDIADRAGGRAVDVDNSGSALADGALNIAAGTLSNSGALQANTGTTVNATRLDNSGSFITSNQHASDSLNLDTLQNSGLLQSSGDLSISATTLSNTASGTLRSSGDMNVLGAGGNASLENSGRIQAGNAFSARGADAGDAIDLSLLDSAVLLADSIDIAADSVNLAGNSGITSRGDLQLSANSLGLSSSGSYIVAASSGAGRGSLDIRSGLSNSGALHSGYDLSVSAPSISNAATGGISAAHDLDLHATVGSLHNLGALYAGHLLTASSATSFTNGYLSQSQHGTVDSGGSIAITAGDSFYNNSTVNAAQDIGIGALHFHNEIPGGGAKAWGAQTAYGGSEYDGQTIEDQSSAGFTVVQHYHHTATQTEYFTAGEPPSLTPQIVGGATVTIEGFHDGYNRAGLIVGDVVRLTGADGSATFVNDDLSLLRTTYTRAYAERSRYTVLSGFIPWPTIYYDPTSTTATYQSFDSSIRAGTLHASVAGLINQGSPFGPDVNARDKTGASATGASSGLHFGGLDLVLPGNPNGYFVPSQKPDARYLIETNPRYTLGGGLGSNYLVERLGYNPDDIQRRLGDAGYENYLVRQQLVQQIGTSLLSGYASEKTQIQGLFDAAVRQSSRLGLQFGQPLSATQLAGLEQDLVWMVETEVKGQKVLAPVVYLSQATRQGIEHGAVIAASDTQLDVNTLSNVGGTIAGGKTLEVRAKGDISNLSGNIKGGDVALQSSQGSVINQTVTRTSEAGTRIATSVGKQAGISASGVLDVNAAKDITNLGANMSAGGDARLKAGENIRFDTVARTTGTELNRTEDGQNVRTVEKTTEQIRSGLTAGGKLSAEAGQDITLRGTEAKAGGDARLLAGQSLSLEAAHDSRESSRTGESWSSSEKASTQSRSGLSAGGSLSAEGGQDVTLTGADVTVAGDARLKAGENLNIQAAHDTREATSESHRSGFGVGGGLWGSEKTTTQTYDKTASGSNLKVGGSTTAEAGKTLTVEGSTVDTAGTLQLSAEALKVKAAENLHTSTTTTETTTILPMSTSAKGSASADAQAEATAAGNKAGASAKAEAKAGSEASVTFAQTETTTTTQTDLTHTGSQLKAGGDMALQARQDITLQGSSAEAKGDVSVKGHDLKVLSAEDVHTTSSSTRTTTVGIFSDNSAEAKAEAEASASGSERQAGASAEASAEAKSENTIGVRVKQSDSLTQDTRNQAASIKAGGSLDIKAERQLTVVGSDIETAGNATVEAQDMSFQAAEDKHLASTSTKTTTSGLVLEGKAKAEASAKGELNTGKAAGKAKAEAGAEAGASIGVKRQDESSSEGSSTARVSTLKAGGDLIRTAQGKIEDVGTQIEAGGNVSQSAREIESKAAANTSFSSSESTTHDARIGVYAEANASAEAAGGVQGGAKTKAEADAAAGVRAKYQYDQTSSGETSSKAVTSSIKAGGSISSSSKEKTSLEGTQLQAGKDVSLEAGALDYKAAQDSHTSRSDKTSAGGEVKVGASASKAVDASLAGSYEGGKSETSETQAVTGGITAGGNVKLKTRDDARFEGTNIAAGGDAAVEAGGNVSFDEARNTSSSSSSKQSVEAKLSASKSNEGEKEMGLEAKGGVERSTSSRSDAVVGAITSGGKLSVSAGKDASFEGTQLQAGGDASVKAGGDVNMNAAQSSASSSSWNASAELKLGKEEQELKAGGGYKRNSETTSQVATLKSGGNLKLEAGRDVTLQGSEVEAQGKAGISAGRDVNVKAAENRSESLDVSASLSLSRQSPDQDKDKSTSGKSSESGAPQSAKKAEPASDTPTPTVAQQDKAGDGAKPSADAKAGDDKTGDPQVKPTGTSWGANFALEGDKQSERKGASIKGGQVEIEAGRNASVEGGQISAGSDARIAAGGDVDFKTADSTQLKGGLSLGKEVSGGARLGKAELSSDTERAGTQLQAGGKLEISSGGATRFSGTQASAGGQATLQAAAGVEEQSATSSKLEIGLKQPELDKTPTSTSISAAGGTVRQQGTGAGAEFKASVVVPATMPQGKQLEARTADGKPLPGWLKFDAKTGQFTGKPPADFKGVLSVLVKVPQADGTVKSVPMKFEVK